MMTKEQIQEQDDTIKACLDVAPSPSGTYYLIETTFATFPKFVVGEIRDSDHAVRYICRSGAEWSAREAWQQLTERKSA